MPFEYSPNTNLTLSLIQFIYSSECSIKVYSVYTPCNCQNVCLLIGKPKFEPWGLISYPDRVFGTFLWTSGQMRILAAIACFQPTIWKAMITARKGRSQCWDRETQGRKESKKNGGNKEESKRHKKVERKKHARFSASELVHVSGHRNEKIHMKLMCFKGRIKSVTSRRSKKICEVHVSKRTGRHGSLCRRLHILF
jgi:hypothetical protein